MIDQVDLKDFLEKTRSHILMCFNVSSLDMMFGENEKNSKLLKYSFFLKEENNSNFTVLKLAQDSKFFIEKNPFDFSRLHQIVLEAEQRWYSITHLPFPDVCIMDEKTSSFSYADGKSAGLIKVCLEDIKDLRKFKFVLSHELGHYYYNHYEKTKTENSFRFLNFFKKNYFSWFAILIIISNLVLISLYFQESSKILLPAYIISFAGAIGYSYLTGIDLITYKERFLNYSQEFFADHFARFFTKEKVKINDYELIGGSHAYNLFTHPGGHHRLLNIDENKRNNLQTWKNPSVIKPELFSECSHFERSVYIKMVKSKLKVKFLVFKHKLNLFLKTKKS